MARGRIWGQPSVAVPREVFLVLRGRLNFLSRTTGILAAVFFLLLVWRWLTLRSNKPKTTGSVMQEAVQSQPVSQPTRLGGEAPESPADAGSKAKDVPK